ncbi:MAG: hypothetical protein DMG58_22660 [Acidobacteria bacterium]|nr:MAG: hypothetical protein DMG58_22660 [Acidobacteriota bacterium]
MVLLALRIAAIGIIPIGWTIGLLRWRIADAPPSAISACWILLRLVLGRCVVWRVLGKRQVGSC